VLAFWFFCFTLRQIGMNSLVDVQELARRFNEDEAVWRCYEKRRAERRRLRSRSPFSEHVLDYLDYLAAEQEGRMVRAIGFFHP
jgi:hypothetical protein